MSKLRNRLVRFSVVVVVVLTLGGTLFVGAAAAAPGNNGNQVAVCLSGNNPIKGVLIEGLSNRSSWDRYLIPYSGSCGVQHVTWNVYWKDWVHFTYYADWNNDGVRDYWWDSWHWIQHETITCGWGNCNLSRDGYIAIRD